MQIADSIFKTLNPRHLNVQNGNMENFLDLMRNSGVFTQHYYGIILKYEFETLLYDPKEEVPLPERSSGILDAADTVQFFSTNSLELVLSQFPDRLQVINLPESFAIVIIQRENSRIKKYKKYGDEIEYRDINLIEIHYRQQLGSNLSQDSYKKAFNNSSGFSFVNFLDNYNIIYSIESSGEIELNYKFSYYVFSNKEELKYFMAARQFYRESYNYLERNVYIQNDNIDGFNFKAYFFSNETIRELANILFEEGFAEIIAISPFLFYLSDSEYFRFADVINDLTISEVYPNLFQIEADTNKYYLVVNSDLKDFLNVITKSDPESKKYIATGPLSPKSEKQLNRYHFNIVIPKKRRLSPNIEELENQFKRTRLRSPPGS